MSSVVSSVVSSRQLSAIFAEGGEVPFMASTVSDVTIVGKIAVAIRNSDVDVYFYGHLVRGVRNTGKDTIVDFGTSGVGPMHLRFSNREHMGRLLSDLLVVRGRSLTPPTIWETLELGYSQTGTLNLVDLDHNISKMLRVKMEILSIAAP